MKILAVDDEPGILNSLRREISVHDHEFTGAGSAGEGLEWIKTERLDVVISDQMMPGMKGIEFLSIVREVQPQAVRILLTGQAPEQELSKAIGTGAVHHHISKPWKSCKLFEIIGAGNQCQSGADASG